MSRLFSQRHPIQEVLEVAISDIRNIKTSIFFYEKPHSGKMFSIEVLRDIIGQDFCSSISIHDLNDKYRLANLNGKKLNTCAEIKDEGIKDISMFKQVTGGDTITGELKFQNPVSFQSRALMIFAGNQMPKINSLLLPSTNPWLLTRI